MKKRGIKPLFFLYFCSMVFNSDNNDLERGFINKDKLLQYVSEEDIFELVFGYKPIPYDYVTSPLRKDNNPGCYFDFRPNGRLCFVDFGGNIRINGRDMVNIDCFDAVQLYYNFTNLYSTLEFIYKKLILGSNIKRQPKINNIKRQPKRKKKTEILITTRTLQKKDQLYWEEYGITKQNLIEDNVFPITGYTVKNGKNGDYHRRIYDLCYAYTDFEEGRKKIYRPYQKGKNKFLTNCKASDVGGINKLSFAGHNLVISKSYKDYRVLKNLGLDVVWFQNEGMFPEESLLKSLCMTFDYVTVFFDNDETGIKTATKLVDLINSYYSGKAEKIYLPTSLLKHNVKDPSDFYKKYNEKLLIRFLKEKNLL